MQVAALQRSAFPSPRFGHGHTTHPGIIYLVAFGHMEKEEEEEEGEEEEEEEEGEKERKKRKDGESKEK